MNKLIIAIVVIVVAGTSIYFVVKDFPTRINVTENRNVGTTTPSTDNEIDEVEKNPGESVIGQSVESRDITAYHFGTGETRLMFVGGIHGGYSWNTVLVAYEMMDYLKANSSVIPANIKVTVIPVLNPDGLKKVVGTSGRFTAADVPTKVSDTVVGRFNAHEVDLNRNFDCDWKSSGKWQNKTVSGGGRAFSESESQALRDYVEAHKLAAVVTYYSAAGGVYASSCDNGISVE